MSKNKYRIQCLLSIFIAAVFILGACAPNNSAQETVIVQTETSNITAVPTSDIIKAATATAEPSQPPESVPPVEPTQIATQELVYTGENIFSEIDGMEMIYIPAGAFIMGQTAEEIMAICALELDRDTCDMLNSPDEEPVHIVNLNGFWIDKTEVTNAMYQKCISADVCSAPYTPPSSPPDGYFIDPKYADFPVNRVYWDQAQTYCQWAGRSLPTEAQWEKAARGVDGRTYPWGNAQPTDKLANFDKVVSATNFAVVGSYPSGASPYGVLDMAGNVEEWVADWYDETYYAVSPIENPTGPDSGRYHIQRGGYSSSIGPDIISSIRYWSEKSSYPDIGTGFRCAVNTNDETPTTPAIDRTLRLTDPLMQGDDVKLMQQRLFELGFTEVGTPDGIFGKMTQQAVRNFQKANGLEIDGIAGPKTWILLFSEDAAKAK